MSKTADKTANRSALKSKFFNPKSPREPLRVVPTPKVSWWTAGAAPDADAKFTELARERDAQKSWSNVVPHAMNPRGECV